MSVTRDICEHNRYKNKEGILLSFCFVLILQKKCREEMPRRIWYFFLVPSTLLRTALLQIIGEHADPFIQREGFFQYLEIKPRCLQKRGKTVFCF